MRHTTCVLLDSDAEFRRCLREWLERAGDIVVVGETQDKRKTEEIIAIQQPHVLLADLAALGGVEGVARIAARFPETRLIILHRQEEQADVLGALRQGAWGHLARETLSPKEVVEAIRAVAHGDAYLSPSIAGRLVEDVARRLRERKSDKGKQFPG